MQNLNRIFSMECFKLAIKRHYGSWVPVSFSSSVGLSPLLGIFVREEVATRTKECNIKIMSFAWNSFVCCFNCLSAGCRLYLLCVSMWRGHSHILASWLFCDVDAIESSYESFFNVFSGCNLLWNNNTWTRHDREKKQSKRDILRAKNEMQHKWQTINQSNR